MNKIECFIAGYAFCLLVIYLFKNKSKDSLWQM